jgi:cell division protein FtsZ
MAIEMIEEFSMGTQIKVIGVGGGGGNAVEHMINQGVRGSISSARTPTRRR